jgi:curved DNA-binding protein CbpA
MKKYFEILELDVSASIEEVEQAYKELAEAWRPENYQNLPRFKRKAEIKLEEINDAYERVRSFLLVKASGAQQVAFDSAKDPSPEPETEMPPAEQTQPPQISTPSQKKILLPGLIAVAAVLGVLMLYLISDRQKPQNQMPQPIATQKDKSAQDSDTASPPVSADHPQKESESNSATKFNAEKRAPSAKPAAPKPPAKIRPDYDRLLTQAALSRYNRNPVRVKRVQNGLITVGYNTGPIDGVIGPQTTAALRKFAYDRGLTIEASDLLTSDLTNAVLVFAEVSAKHPDWDRIIGSQDFAHWLSSQKVLPAYQVKKMKNSATARQVAGMLDLYKSNKKTP